MKKAFHDLRLLKIGINYTICSLPKSIRF